MAGNKATNEAGLVKQINQLRVRNEARSGVGFLDKLVTRALASSLREQGSVRILRSFPWIELNHKPKVELSSSICPGRSPALHRQSRGKQSLCLERGVNVVRVYSK